MVSSALDLADFIQWLVYAVGLTEQDMNKPQVTIQTENLSIYAEDR